MRKTAHQIWKESKEQGLTPEEFKQKLIDLGVIIPKGKILTSVVKSKTDLNKPIETVQKNCSVCGCEFPIL